MMSVPVCDERDVPEHMPAFGSPSVAVWVGGANWESVQGPPVTREAAGVVLTVQALTAAPATEGVSAAAVTDVPAAGARAPSAPTSLVPFTVRPFRRPSGAERASTRVVVGEQCQWVV